MLQKKIARNISLDIMRGYFLAVIIIDHIGRFPNPFEILTGEGKLWVSAAEGFFIISGLLVGLLYAKKFKENPKKVFKKLWTRALVLYLCSVGLTLVFTLWGRTMPPQYVKYGIDNTSNFIDLIKNTLLFKYTFGWADFLPYYVIFLLFSPFVIFLVNKINWKFVIAISLIAWCFRSSSPFLAWQAVFMTGLVVGSKFESLESGFNNLKQNKKIWITRILTTITVVTIGISVYFVFINKINVLNNIFDKDTQGIGRIILAWIWFPTMYLLIRQNEKFIDKYTKGFFKTLGQNSLKVYLIHSILLFPINMIFPNVSFFENIFVTGGVLFIVYVWVD
ncbi:hypothetical protein BH10PAT1_BH10PAT1_6010 [soil metagenome]